MCRQQPDQLLLVGVGAKHGVLQPSGVDVDEQQDDEHALDLGPHDGANGKADDGVEQGSQQETRISSTG
jgi:hypothetical protein